MSLKMRSGVIGRIETSIPNGDSASAMAFAIAAGAPIVPPSPAPDIPPVPGVDIPAPPHEEPGVEPPIEEPPLDPGVPDQSGEKPLIA